MKRSRSDSDEDTDPLSPSVSIAVAAERPSKRMHIPPTPPPQPIDLDQEIEEKDAEAHEEPPSSPFIETQSTVSSSSARTPILPGPWLSKSTAQPPGPQREVESPDAVEPAAADVTTSLGYHAASGLTLAAVEGRFTVDITTTLSEAKRARDARVTFLHEPHLTFVDDGKEPYAGVTDTITRRFFTKFDPVKKSESIARYESGSMSTTLSTRIFRLDAEGKYRGKYKGKSALEMQMGWNARRDAGTKQHTGKELVLRGLPLNDEQQRHVKPGFIKFLLDHPRLTPVEIERRVFSAKTRLAGAFDGLFAQTKLSLSALEENEAPQHQRRILLDWKHCELWKLISSPSMERAMIDLGILLGPVIYSDADARKADIESAAAIQQRHKTFEKEIRARLRQVKKDRKEMRTVAALWKESKAEAGLPVDGDADDGAGDDDDDLNPESRAMMEEAKARAKLPPIPDWWKRNPYKAIYGYGTHPLTEHLPAESIVEYAIQVNWYQGILEDEAEEEGWPAVDIEERWIVNFPPERPAEYEIYRIGHLDHRYGSQR